MKTKEHLENIIWHQRLWIMTIIVFGIIVLQLGNVKYHNAMDLVEQLEKETPNNLQSLQPCFYDFQLAYECGKSDGNLIPLVEKQDKYWTCSTLSYKVYAC